MAINPDLFRVYSTSTTVSPSSIVPSITTPLPPGLKVGDRIRVQDCGHSFNDTGKEGVLTDINLGSGNEARVTFADGKTNTFYHCCIIPLEVTRTEEWVPFNPSKAKVGMKMRHTTKVWEITSIKGPDEDDQLQVDRKFGKDEECNYFNEDTEDGRWKMLIEVKNGQQSGKGAVTFDSVILPNHKKEAIVNAIKQIDNHDLIFSEWGFEDVFEKGTAISMLFHGEPGTGKTLMGQAIADKYGYELKIISTAEIETPEPGGAERNIKKAFKEAEESKKMVLLFDECDSLVSSRKHMGSILAAQVNALLTELEHYTGIVIFTTNRIETLDEAFDRRLSLKLEFEMPDEDHRAKIWERMLPTKAPLAKDVDFKELAIAEIAGGHIKNVVLQAARMAANADLPAEKKRITQGMLIKCLRQEVESKVAYVNAKENEPFYGTALGSGRTTVEKVRNRAKVGLDRG